MRPFSTSVRLFFELLTRTGDHRPHQQVATADLRIVYVTHQPEIVQLTFHAAPQVGGLANIKSLKGRGSPAAAEDVYAGVGGNLVKVDRVAEFAAPP